MSEFKYKEKLGNNYSNVTINVMSKKAPLMARIFGKRISSTDEDQHCKCETESIIYRGVIYITNQIIIEKEQINEKTKTRIN